MKGDLDALIKIIFEDTPKLKKSISIVDSFESLKDLFEALLMIFTKGMNILYGDKSGSVHLKNLSEMDFLKFKTYFEAIGITPFFHHFHIAQVSKIKNEPIDEETITNWEKNKVNFKNNLLEKYLTKYNTLTSNKLEDMYFQLKCDYDVYIVYFNYTN